MFAKNLPKDDTRPHLLLLDGHGSHVFNLSFLQLMKENNIHPICFPPHTTHWLQPADKTFFKSFKHSWTTAGGSFMRENAGKRPDRKQFFRSSYRLGQRRQVSILLSLVSGRWECFLLTRMPFQSMHMNPAKLQINLYRLKVNLPCSRGPCIAGPPVGLFFVVL